MKFKIGDKVYIKVMNTQREGVIVWAYPEREEVQVSVDHGAGGFHIVKESELTSREE